MSELTLDIKVFLYLNLFLDYSCILFQKVNYLNCLCRFCNLLLRLFLIKYLYIFYPFRNLIHKGNMILNKFRWYRLCPNNRRNLRRDWNLIYLVILNRWKFRFYYALILLLGNLIYYHRYFWEDLLGLIRRILFD